MGRHRNPGTRSDPNRFHWVTRVAGDFKKIGITKPTAEQWGQLGYRSGMLLIYRGAKCANEEFISDAEIEKGKLGPCGYGEHDDASYQWGIDGDPMKDSGVIIGTTNREMTEVFSYKDNWHASSETLHAVDEGTKREWQVKEKEWEPRQQFAVQITNELTRRGLDVHASASVGQPEQLDFQSLLFKDAEFRQTFINKGLPQIRSELCGAGFRRVRILQATGPGQTYALSCP